MPETIGHENVIRTDSIICCLSRCTSEAKTTNKQDTMRLISEMKQRAKKKREHASQKTQPFEAARQRLSLMALAETRSPRGLMH
jgi:hypothetical protein